MTRNFIVVSLLLCILLSSCYVQRRNELSKDLDVITARYQANEQEYQRIIAKKNSLYEAGNIQDSTADNTGMELKGYRTYADSLHEDIKFYQHRLKFRVGFMEEYPKIKENMGLLRQRLVKDSAQNNTFFKTIEKRLDAGDLSGEKKQLKTILGNASAQQEKDAATVSNLGGAKDSLFSSGKVADVTAAAIDGRLSRYQKRMDSMNAEIKTVSAKLETPADFRKDFSIIKAKIQIIDSVINKNAAVREYSFKMLEEGMANAKPNLFSLAAFFGPGGYIIPQDKIPFAKQYFSPIIDSLVKFSNKYETLFRIAGLVVNGYADASKISPGSKLYNVIADYLKNDKPTKEELNAGLSALRAEEISKLLESTIKERYPEFKSIDKVIIEYVQAGNGEKLPDPKIKDYKTNDERRRIVIIFWSVLPDL
jgi:cell division protein FtsL